MTVLRNLYRVLVVYAVWSMLSEPVQSFEPERFQYQASGQYGHHVFFPGANTTESTRHSTFLPPSAVLWDSTRDGDDHSQAGSRAEVDAVGMMAPYAQHLGVDPGRLVPGVQQRDGLGMTHIRYAQVHHGVPVYGADVVAHVSPHGRLSSINGRTLPKIDVDPTPRIDAAAAVRAALGHHPAGKACSCPLCQCSNAAPGPSQHSAPQPPRLYVYNDGLVSNGQATESRLAWEVLVTNGVDQNAHVYVDAHSGAVFKTADQTNHIQRYIYDCSDPFQLAGCLIDAHSTLYSYYFGRSEGMPPRGPSPFGPPFTGSTDVDDAYEEFVPSIELYYMTTFGRNGGNDRGGIGDGGSVPYERTSMFVHINGVSSICNPGYASAGPWNVNACVGNVDDHDLMGHEYGHLVSRYRSFDQNNIPNSLINQNESGALNEMHSDLFGEAFENFRTGTNDWVLFADSNPPIGGIRSLADAPSGSNVYWPTPNPDRFYHQYVYCGPDDSGGIHVNATVPGKAAYLTAVGESFNGWIPDGIGFDQVQQIWYRALIHYYSNTETFNGAYVALRQATRDLYGDHSFELSQVTMALRAVEMDQPGLCSGLPLRRWGDFDQNDLFTGGDIDALVAAIASGSANLSFDMNGDDLVTAADLEVWRFIAGHFTLGAGRSYLPADANLDGVVDGSDFGIWNANKFTSVAAWTSGDFNADGVVDGSDFGIWNANKFTASAATAVPEPSGLAILYVLPSLARRISRRALARGCPATNRPLVTFPVK